MRVQAHNRAPEPSSLSGWSASEIPAGPPMPAAAPTTAEIPGVGNQAQMQVSWEPGSANFAAIKEWNKADVYDRTIAAMADQLSGG